MAEHPPCLSCLFVIRAWITSLWWWLGKTLSPSLIWSELCLSLSFIATLTAVPFCSGHVRTFCSEQAARPNMPSCCQMNIFSVLLVTSLSTDTFLLEVMISSRARIFRSERDWSWPRKCLSCTAAAEWEVCIYSVALQAPPFILGVESLNLVVFSTFQFLLTLQPSQYSLKLEGPPPALENIDTVCWHYQGQGFFFFSACITWQRPFFSCLKQYFWILLCTELMSMLV